MQVMICLVVAIVFHICVHININTVIYGTSSRQPKKYERENK